LRNREDIGYAFVLHLSVAAKWIAYISLIVYPDTAPISKKKEENMKVKISKMAHQLYRSVSPVRQIMNFADKNKLKEYGLREEDFISFGGGWVNHRAPKDLRGAYLRYSQNDDLFHRSGAYSPTNGEQVFKEALVKYEKEIFGMEDIRPEHIVVGQSSTHLTYLLLRILLDDNDKICILDPSYCNYPMQIYTTTSCKLIRFPVIDTSDFSYIANLKGTIPRLKSFLLKNKPKVILLISPDNPTGQVLSDNFVAACYESVKKYGGAVVIDFAYKDITFIKIPDYFSWGPDDNFITIHSNSKWCHGLGRRLGWVEAPKYIVDAFDSFLNSSILCPDSLHQLATTEYIEKAVKNGSLKKYINNIRVLYKETAALTTEAIRRFIKLPHLTPRGGIYTCIQVHENGARFVENVLRKTGVLLIPGWGFGPSLNKSVRLSYGPLVHDHDLITKGLSRVGQFLGR
jgi:aspartate aminotransferase